MKMLNAAAATAVLGSMLFGFPAEGVADESAERLERVGVGA